MQIKAGFDIAFECPAPTPMLLQLNVHPSREADLLTPDRIVSDPPFPMRNYLDLFGNRVTRVEVLAGLVTFSDRFLIHDSGAAGPNAPGREDDADRRPSRRDASVPGLEPLLRQRQARRFRLVEFREDLRRIRRMQAISDFVHGDPFDYMEARPTRTASDSMHEGVGVCRDFAHLAIALCRCMNIPARYCTGYLGDIGVPVDSTPWISAPGSKSFSTAVGGRWTRGTTIRALAAS